VTVDARTWPLPRRSRTGPAPSGAGIIEAGDAPGRTRIWTFSLNEANINKRGTVVSPRFLGPGYVVDMTLYGLAVSQTNPFEKFQLTISPTAGTQGSNQALTIVPPGDSIFDMSTAIPAGPDDGLGPGFPFANGIAGAVAVPVRFNYRTVYNPFFLNVAVVARAALQQYIQGVIRVLEGSPELPPEFMLS
jgi:hypothetical protein